MRRLSYIILVCLILTNCTVFKPETTATPIPTPTEDICPNNGVRFWYGYMKQIEDDTTLLYGVAESCNDSECYRGIAEKFWKFSDEYIDNFGKPPVCVSLIHEMIRQNLRDEGEAFLAISENNFEKSIALKERVLERMDEIDRLLIPILEEGLNVNHMNEIFIAAQTQTAIPTIILSNPKPTPKPIFFRDYFSFQLEEDWCIYNDFLDDEGRLIFNMINNCSSGKEPLPSVMLQLVDAGEDFDDEFDVAEALRKEGESLGLEYEKFEILTGIEDIYINGNKVYTLYVSIQDFETGPSIVQIFKINNRYFQLWCDFSPLILTFSPEGFPEFFPEDFEYSDMYLIKISNRIIATIRPFE